MLQTSQCRIHPLGLYKVFQCITCQHVTEEELPYYWFKCLLFLRELKKHSLDECLAFKEDLLTLLKTRMEQNRLLDLYNGMAKTIQVLESEGDYYNRDWVYTTVRRNEKILKIREISELD